MATRKLLVGLATAVVLAGCGRTSTPVAAPGHSSTTQTTAPNYLAQLDAVCRRYQPQLDALGQQWRALNANTTASELNALGSQTTSLFNQVTGAINAVQVPASESNAVGHWVGDLTTANTAITSLVGDVEGDNAQATKTDVTHFEAAMKAAHSDRVRLGIGC